MSSYQGRQMIQQSELCALSRCGVAATRMNGARDAWRRRHSQFLLNTESIRPASSTSHTQTSSRIRTLSDTLNGDERSHGEREFLVRAVYFVLYFGAASSSIVLSRSPHNFSIFSWGALL